MISRAEFLYTKSRITRIKDTLDTIELGVYDPKDPRYEVYQQYQTWKDFNALPWAQQSEIRASWNAYYQVCVKSPAAKRFFEAKDAGKRGDMAKVKDLANEARLDIELKLSKEIPRPGKWDPDELNRKLYWIVELKKEMDLLTKQYNEYKDVYEKKDKQSDFGGVQDVMGIL